MNGAVLVLISFAVFGLGYGLYSRFLAGKVLALDASRKTPAVRLQDGRDYVPTSRWVIFFYHFATISGSGVLVGPTLAAQYGWLPCILWILIATCLAGGVHDLVILAASVRHEGKSIAQIALAEVGPVTGTAVMIAILFLVTTAMAGLGLGAVAALEHNPWGTFSVAMTIPVALLLAAYLRWIRPGRIGEASLIGVALLLLALFIGPAVRDSAVGGCFDLDKQRLTILLAAYAFIAAVLPVGVLVRPRDYLSAYIKAGTVLLLILGVLIARPTLHMPAVTQYVSGGGPVVPGALWPFLFIIITCGAISGWHALCCSGVTPKLIANERDVRPVAYGGWLLESCCAVLALVLAVMLLPGDYFAINAKTEAFAKTALTPVMLPELARDVGMDLQAKPGGPVSLAVSMTLVFSRLFGGEPARALWYQFAILFLGVFAIAVMDHGTRIARYLVQEVAGHVRPAWGRVSWWPGAVVGAGLGALAWGWLLYTGEVSTLWPVFGICNQLLATMGLAVGTTFILRSSRPAYALTTALPMLFFAVACVQGGIMKVLQSFKPSADAVAHVQGAIIAIVIVLVAVVLVDSTRKWGELLRRLRAVQNEGSKEGGAMA